MTAKRGNLVLEVKRHPQEWSGAAGAGMAVPLEPGWPWLSGHAAAVPPLHLSGACDLTCQDMFDYVVTFFFKIVNFVGLAVRKKVARSTG